MLNRLKKMFHKTSDNLPEEALSAHAATEVKPPKSSLANIDFDLVDYKKEEKRNRILQQYETQKFPDRMNPASFASNFICKDPSVTGITTDAAIAEDSSFTLKEQNRAFQNIPATLLNWYNSQSFIGWPSCALIYQNWLAKKACEMPAEDAVRNGYELTVNDGSRMSAEIIDDIRKMDEKFLLNKNMREFITMGRVFGVRVAMFDVQSKDPDYYKLPFNIDGVEPGSYKGISQIDPYWLLAQLDADASSNPASRHFYEPTWWKVGNKLVHRTHLVIYRNGELPDILKPV